MLLSSPFPSCVDGIAADTSHAQIDLGTQYAAQAVHELEVFDDSAESIAAHFSVESINDDSDIFAAEGGVELVVLETLQSHDRGDLSVCHELSTEIEEGREVGMWKIWGLVRVRCFGCGRGDIARRRAGCHKRMAGEWHIFIIGLSHRPTAEVVCVFTTRPFQSVAMQ